MCNVLARLEAMAPFVQGRALHQLYPPQFMQNWPYHQVRPGCCINPVCGRRMSNEEMFPVDKLTPRAMCPECYAEWTYTVTEQCPVCGDYLENWRIDEQKYQPNEVTLRLHDGRCLDYFSLLSGKALGQYVGIIDEAYGYGYPQQMPQHVLPKRGETTQQDYIDGEYTDIDSGEGKALPPACDTGGFQTQPVRTVIATYKGKEVKVIQNERRGGGDEYRYFHYRSYRCRVVDHEG